MQIFMIYPPSKAPSEIAGDKRIGKDQAVAEAAPIFADRQTLQYKTLPALLGSAIRAPARMDIRIND
jgi:hypothetical protein